MDDVVGDDVDTLHVKRMTCSGHRNIGILVDNPTRCCEILEYLIFI
jgi:hypothetical protein